MRLTVARLRRVIKRDFAIQFGREQLTSYGGLELLRRFLVLIGLKARIQCAFAARQLPAFSANNAQVQVDEKGLQTRAGARARGGAKGQTGY
jgi:hypothetical protein